MTDTSQAAPPPQQPSFLGRLAEAAKTGAKIAFPAEASLYHALNNIPPPQPAQSPGQAEAALPPPSQPLGPTQPTVPAPPPVSYAYIPPKGDVPPEDLGKPHWSITAAEKHPGPLPPGQFNQSPREAYKYGGQGAGYLARFGNPAVAGPAQAVANMAGAFAPILDWLSGGGFSRNFSATTALGLQRQLGELKVRQEEFMLKQDMAIQAQQTSLERYGRVFTLATMKDKNGNPLLSGDELEQEVENIARSDQDNSVLVALHNGGLPQAIKQLQENRRNMLMMQGSSVALKKMTAGEKTDAEIQREYGETTDESGQGLGQSEAFNMPAGGETAPVGATPAVAPKTAEEFDDAIKKEGLGITDEMLQAGHDIYDGRFDPKELARIRRGSPTVAGKIDHVQREIAQNVDAVANSDASPEDKVAKIGVYSPNKAQTLRGLYDYSLDPKQHKGDLDLTKRVFGDRYKEGNYDAVKKWEDENSATRKNIDRIGSIPQSMLTTYQTLNRFDENSSVVQNKLQQWWAGTLGGDDKYKVLFDSLFDLDQHFQAVASFTGTPRVGPLMKQIENLGSTATPSQVRNVIDVNARSAYNALNTYQTNWQKLSNRNTLMPGIDPDKWKLFRDMIRVNKMTGQMPTDAQPEALGVSRDPSQARKGLTETEKLPPLTMDQIRKGQERYHELATSPDPDKQKQAREFLDRVGPIIGIGNHIPEVDD